MSTPVDLNIVMPYGVTVEGDGSRNARIVTDSTQASSDIALKLPDGPCRVAASWDGPEEVRLVHTGHGYPVKIPAGGIAPGWLLSALRRAKLSTCRTLRLRRSRRAGAALSRSTHSSLSSSNHHPQGGGVGDHPEHQHRRGLRRTAGDSVVRGHYKRTRQCELDRLEQLVRAITGGRVHHFGQLPQSNLYVHLTTNSGASYRYLTKEPKAGETVVISNVAVPKGEKRYLQIRCDNPCDVGVTIITWPLT